ncbi:N-acetyltransferase [bacterium]|nr:MAG: N-acetyltransferase [bacterium]
MEIYFNAEASRFEIEKNGLLSIAEFEMKPGVMLVTHMVVPPSLRGGGIASTLAAGVVEHARKEHLKIQPLCSFMQVYIERHPETRDLVA